MSQTPKELLDTSAFSGKTHSRVTGIMLALAEYQFNSLEKKQRAAFLADKKQEQVEDKASKITEKDIVAQSLRKMQKAYDESDFSGLEKVLKQAEVELGKPLGKAYELILNAEKLDASPNMILCDACEKAQIDIVILLGKAGFNLDKRSGLYSPLETAIKKKNYKLIDVLVELGANLNPLGRLGLNPLIMNAPRNLEMYHYLSALGIRDDKYLSRPNTPKSLVAAYNNGLTFPSEYRAELIKCLTVDILPILQMLILDYLGNRLSMPVKEIRVKRNSELPPLSQVSHFFLMGKFTPKLDKKSNQAIKKLVKAFDHWMKNTEEHYKTDNEELIRWIIRVNLWNNYEQIFNLAIALSRKGYATNPPPTEAELSAGFEDYQREREDLNSRIMNAFSDICN